MATKKYIELGQAKRALSDEAWHNPYFRQEEYAINVLNKLPIADVVEVIHGHWEWSEHEREYLCSNCGTRFDFQQVHIKFNRLAEYCPICGAVMEESEDK